MSWWKSGWPRALIGTVTLAVSTTAAAEPFGDKGKLVLSAENLTAFTISTQHTSGDTNFNGATDTTTTSVSFLGNTALGNGFPSPYDTPRVAFDWFPVNKFSVGGFLTYSSSTPKFSFEGMSSPLATRSMLALGPRIGYGTALNGRVGVWLRGGPTYYLLAEEDPDPAVPTSTIRGIALGFDALLVFLFGEHVAITAGPSANIGVDGDTDRFGTKVSSDMSSYGLKFSLAGIL